MLHPSFVPGDSVAQEFVAFTPISQQKLSANVYPLLFQFQSEHSGIPSRAQLAVSEISNCRLQSLTSVLSVTAS
jgi:hypothetical protein